jgi:hypothetical protein
LTNADFIPRQIDEKSRGNQSSPSKREEKNANAPPQIKRRRFEAADRSPNSDG